MYLIPGLFTKLTVPLKALRIVVVFSELMNCLDTGVDVEVKYSKCITGNTDVRLMILTSGSVQ